MSIKAVKWALAINGIDATDKLIIVAIAESHNDKTGDCFPSQKYIAEVIGLTTRAIRARLDRLEAASFFTRKPRYDVRGKRTSDQYQLRFDVHSGRRTRAEGHQHYLVDDFDFTKPGLEEELPSASNTGRLEEELPSASEVRPENRLPEVFERLPEVKASASNLCTGRIVPEESYQGKNISGGNESLQARPKPHLVVDNVHHDPGMEPDPHDWFTDDPVDANLPTPNGHDPHHGMNGKAVALRTNGRAA